MRGILEKGSPVFRLVVVIVFVSLFSFSQYFLFSLFCKCFPLLPGYRPNYWDLPENWTWPHTSMGAANAVEDSDSLITHLQDINIEVLGNLTEGYSKAVLLVLNEEAEDSLEASAITMGVLNLMAELKMSIVFFCNRQCTDEQLAEASLELQQYKPSELVVVCSDFGKLEGGRSIPSDVFRTVAAVFENYRILVMSQSNRLAGSSLISEMTTDLEAHPDLIWILKDWVSYQYAHDHFADADVHLATDMAFHLSRIHRFLPPLYDVVWLSDDRPSSESRLTSTFAESVTYVEGDWFSAASPRGKHGIDDAYSRVANGLLFLQRGKILVTDRLHGYILGICLDMPTVIIDNGSDQLHNFRSTWSKGLAHVTVAKDVGDAIDKAMRMLQIYEDVLPRSASGISTSRDL